MIDSTVSLDTDSTESSDTDLSSLGNRMPKRLKQVTIHLI